MDTVLFVCEHGSAKSLVAAAHFNRIASERKLPLRAISRGTDPDEENHPAAIAGLESDDLEPEALPRKLSQADLATARKVIAFAELPAEYSPASPVEVWSVPPISENYDMARSAIVERINRVLQELE
jgi:arsenate reductase (thioredoxin)